MNAKNPGNESKPLAQILVGFDLSIDEQGLLQRLDPKAQSLFLELQSLAQTLQELPDVASPTTNFDVAKFLEYAQACERSISDAEAESNSSAMTNAVDDGPIEAQELGDYQIFEPIGRGGGGTVYRGRHKKLQRDVAIKILNRVDKRTLSRFEREMQTIGSLQHPNVVTATDAREVNGLHFLVMELLSGRNLSQLLKELGPLPVAEASEIIRQAALGLMYIHENDLVHRDIKLSNLFLTNDGQVKILDLGLVLLRDNDASISNMTSTGVTMGSIDFMAPEQAEDTHAVDIRADIYSLGATLYTLLAGQLPFSGPDDKSPIHKLAALASGKPPNLSPHRPDAPPEICRIVERMMARFPAERFSTPALVVEALTPMAIDADLAGLLNLRNRKLCDASSAEKPDSQAKPIQPLNLVTENELARRTSWTHLPWFWIRLLLVGVLVLAAAYFALHRGIAN